MKQTLTAKQRNNFPFPTHDRLIDYAVPAIIIPIGGYVLLYAAAFLDFLFATAVIGIANFLFRPDFSELTWFPVLVHVLFIIVIGLASWFVFRSGLKIIYKAIFMPVPVIVGMITVGLIFYKWPLINYLVSILLVLIIIRLFAKTNQPWIYYYSVIFSSSALIVISLFTGPF